MSAPSAGAAERLHPNAQLAWDTIQRQPTRGIPSWLLNVMDHAHIERIAGEPAGSYRREPERVYNRMQRALGTCMLDQYIPTNPLSMGAHGYEHAAQGATEGVETIVRDGLVIDSPEAVVDHMERFIFPAILRQTREFDEDACVAEILRFERETQERLGPSILKVPYGWIRFPHMLYSYYGYVAYFEAYTVYAEVIEKHFSLTADLAVLQNRAAVRAYREGSLPPLCRSDHDMADSRGTLVDVRSLDRLWFPHFERSIRPALDGGIKIIWHCDGKLMEMVPRLLEIGLHGFQGFQYEDGMDYERICRMKTRDGDDLIIIAGSSVTRTLPRGTPDDVRRELKFLVERGPRTGLFLGGSSSVAPGVPWENMVALMEGLKYYRECGRG